MEDKWRVPAGEWDKRYLRIAREASTWSKDPRAGVGAVLVNRENRLVCTSFNGLPKSIPDDPEILNNREIKLRMIIHAELNALLFHSNDVTGYTIYSYPIPPCMHCASSIIQRGVKRVVSVYNRGHNPKWEEENKFAENLFKQAGVELVLYDRDRLDSSVNAKSGAD